MHREYPTWVFVPTNRSNPTAMPGPDGGHAPTMACYVNADQPNAPNIAADMKRGCHNRVEKLVQLMACNAAHGDRHTGMDKRQTDSTRTTQPQASRCPPPRLNDATESLLGPSPGKSCPKSGTDSFETTITVRMNSP